MGPPEKALILSVDFEDWNQLVRRRVGDDGWDAPGPALAARAHVNCDVNVCVYRCDHRCHGGGYGQQHWSMGCSCASNCLKTIVGRKMDGVCK